MKINILCRVDCCEDEESARMMATCMLNGRVSEPTFGTSGCRVINNSFGKRVSACPANEFKGFVSGSEPLMGADLMGIHALSKDDIAEGDCVYLVVAEATMKWS